MRVIDERGLVYDSRYIYHTALSNQKYAIPNLKKYPLPDRAHVKSAIKFFNYVSPRYEKTLAYAILKRMDEYGMSFDDMTIGDENRFKKYIPKREYLAHHGILGMKWGVRHDHYPLNASEHTAAEKKAGWKDSLSSSKSSDRRKVAKKATKELNRLDKSIGKDEYKLKKLKRKNKLKAFFGGKRAKMSNTYKKRLNEIDNLNAKIKNGQAAKEKLIKDLKANKYGVYSKNYYRSGNELASTGRFLLGYKASGGDFLAGRAAYWLDPAGQTGKKYKVTKHKNDNPPRIRTSNRLGRNVATAALVTVGSNIVKTGLKAYTTKRNAENTRYGSMANRGMLLEQEVIKKARYRQVR